MNEIPIVLRNANLEVLGKILNSVAQKYACHVEYIADEDRLEFQGDQDCCRPITEETLALFPSDDNATPPFNCPID